MKLNVLSVGLGIAVGAACMAGVLAPSVSKNAAGVKYKNFVGQESFGAPIDFELPATWSIARPAGDSESVDSLPNMPTYSVGQHDVYYGDVNWEQVDFYAIQNDVVDRLVSEAKAERKNDSAWSTEEVAGVTATVYTDSLDENGQASKGGSGGKTYYIRMPQQIGQAPRTLVVVQQSAANQEFINGFNHLIRTLEFVGQ